MTHSDIIALHRDIADRHIGIHGFYRFDFAELLGKLRSGVTMPVLLLESPDISYSKLNQANFKTYSISVLLLDNAGRADNYEKVEEVLDRLEGIADDVCTFLNQLSKTEGSIYYSLFDPNTVRMEKVGPLFDNFYGWNILYSITFRQQLCLNSAKWSG